MRVKTQQEGLQRRNTTTGGRHEKTDDKAATSAVDEYQAL
jgi:hypothetical protein